MLRFALLCSALLSFALLCCAVMVSRMAAAVVVVLKWMHMGCGERADGVGDDGNDGHGEDGCEH